MNQDELLLKLKQLEAENVSILSNEGIMRLDLETKLKTLFAENEKLLAEFFERKGSLSLNKLLVWKFDENTCGSR